MNHVHLRGMAAFDAHVRLNDTGERFVNINVGVQGKEQPRTEWFRLVFQEGMVPLASTIRKGDLVEVQGRFQTRQWRNIAGGETRHTTEVIVADLTIIGKVPQ